MLLLTFLLAYITKICHNVSISNLK